MLQLIRKNINIKVTFSRNKARTILVLILYVVNVSLLNRGHYSKFSGSQTILSCHPTPCFCEFFLLLTAVTETKLKVPLMQLTFIHTQVPQIVFTTFLQSVGNSSIVGRGNHIEVLHGSHIGWQDNENYLH